MFDEVSAPIELEVGFGMGRFLLAKAGKNPDVHYLGIEPLTGRVARVDVAARKKGLTNINLMCGKAIDFLEHCIPSQKIRAVYLFFPDPWPKKHHAVRRVLSSAFATALSNVLTEDGAFHVATDHETYYDQMLEILNNHSQFKRIEPLIRTDDERTDFELRFLAKKLPMFSASWRKISTQ